MNSHRRPLLIGVSARIYTPGTPGIQISGIWTKNIHYLEQSVAHWVLSGHAMAVMIPAVTKDSIVTRSDLDLHPKEVKPGMIGQREEERDLLDRLLGDRLVDVTRALAPDDRNLFTWWAPWRNMRQRNIGWRIDYILASPAIAEGAAACVVQREFGTSDHAPVRMTTA